jgi:MFS transporter, DHA1 family, tetracycline resistance protein
MRPATRSTPLIFLFVAVFVDMVGYGILVPLLPFYVRELDAGAVAVGLLGSLYAAMQLLGGPVLGGLSDRVGRRPVLLVCLFGASVAYGLLGLAGSLLLVVAAVALAGASGATLATAQAYVADSTSEEERARGLGLIGAAFGLGLMAGPVLGGLLSLSSLQAPAFFAALLALLNAAFGLLALPESLSPERRYQPGRGSPMLSVRGLLAVRGVGALLLVVFLLNLSFSGLLTNFPLFSAERFGWDPTANAFLFAFVGVCAVTTQGVLLGRLGPILGERNLLLGGLSVMALALPLVAVAPRGFLLYPVVGMLAVGAGLAIPSLAARISRRVPASEQGSAMGAQQAVASSTLILGPLVSGLLFEILGAPSPYLLGGILAALALLAALRAMQDMESEEDGETGQRRRTLQATEHRR